MHLSLFLLPFLGTLAAAVPSRRVQKWLRTAPTFPSDLIVRSPPLSTSEYSNISSAVDALGTTGGSIFVFPGVYHEQVFLQPSYGPITIQGYTENGRDYHDNEVTISYGLNAGVAGNNDKSGTVRASSANVKLYNLNIENTFGHFAQGCQCQAIALSAQAERQGFYGLNLTGYQDTLLANRGAAIYAKSAIAGAVDFIFGQYSPSYFYSSDIITTSMGAVTAPGRLTNDSAQLYVFDECNVIASPTAAANTTGGTVLGRPWKEYGRVVFRNSWLGPHLSPAGWTQWNNATPNVAQSVLAEFKTRGPGSYEANAASRAPFAKLLTKDEAKAYTIEKVLGSDYQTWVDMDYASGAD
ncbi:carbohydrate esterase family 8 protein [Mrakia frigida]|uniref:carbohydrate esterase family 8 protein n=1 Tax=Mrakia frigida TaxID=29902 RepID=UPI003FCC1F2E